jgi:hypothetical protein
MSLQQPSIIVNPINLPKILQVRQIDVVLCLVGEDSASYQQHQLRPHQVLLIRLKHPLLLVHLRSLHHFQVLFNELLQINEAYMCTLSPLHHQLSLSVSRPKKLYGPTTIPEYGDEEDSARRPT